MAMPKSDLMAALGTPPESDAKGGPGGYLASKPAQLRGYLMDAVDSSLSNEARAEALCRAIENAGDEEPDEDDSESASSDSGYSADSEDDS